MEGVEEEIKKYGYHLIFSVVGDELKNKPGLADIIDRVDGLLLAGCSIEKKTILGLKEKEIPLVLVDNHLEGEKISSVAIDNVNGAYEAVRHLIKLGHKRIGFISETLNDLSFSERLEGYKIALKKYNLDYDEKLVQEGGQRMGGGYIAMGKLLDNSSLPLAVFAANDHMADEAMRMIRERKLEIPRDVSIIGFDDDEVLPHTHPDLTTVKVFKKQMGRIAGRMLMDIINDKNTPAVKNLVSTELVVRKSCGAKFKGSPK
jgi:DNA-binding LacI/PurR family transcriptional regulator